MSESGSDLAVRSPSPLRLLLVEDSAADAELLVWALKKHGYTVQWQRLDSRVALQQALANGPWDIVLCDHVMPGLGSFEALHLVRESYLDLPFIVISGSIDEEEAVQLLHAGASDYMLKDRLARLGPAVEQAMNAAHERQARRLAESALRESEERLRLALAAADQGLFDLDLRTGEALVTPEYATMLGYDPAEFRETHAAWLERLHPDDQPEVEKRFRDYIEGRTSEYRVEFRQRAAGGGWVWVLSLGKVVERDAAGLPLRMLGTHTDITALKESAAERTRLASAVEQVAEAVMITDTAGTIQYVNAAFETLTGFSRREAVGQNPRLLKSGRQDPEFYRGLWQTLAAGKTWSGRMVNCRKDGSQYTDESAISPVRDAAGRVVSYVAVKRDITAQLQEIAQQERLREQLVQAQKMESVGRLAGGVAHDFNNMLSVILGHAEMGLLRVGADDPIRADLEEIHKATERSADLTRQLLAFARKQAVQPRVLDLGETVAGMMTLLRRLIREDIELHYQPGSGLHRVRIDPSQVGQVVANLVVNARDAITGPGRIRIATANAVRDDSEGSGRPGGGARDYVALTIEDDGMGMDEEVRSHIFEPFFTTKGEGQGTGLGLAMIYGIVDQNRGFIEVQSERGRGTRISVHLPAVLDASEVAEGAVPVAVPLSGDETVLLVEDERALLEVGRKTLARLGYRVLAAGTPTEAMRLAEAHAGTIDLLVTDVIMPEMNGEELSRRLAVARPGLRSLFMSGYTADIIGPGGVLAEGVHFLQKPFSAAAMAEKVREALGDRSRVGSAP